MMTMMMTMMTMMKRADIKSMEWKRHDRYSEGQATAVSSPAIQCQQLTASLVLLAEILGHPAADLSEGTAHDSAEIALFRSRLAGRALGKVGDEKGRRKGVCYEKSWDRRT